MICSIIWAALLVFTGWIIAGIMSPEYRFGIHAAFIVGGVVIGTIIPLIRLIVEKWTKKWSGQELILKIFACLLGLFAVALAMDFLEPVLTGLSLASRTVVTLWSAFLILWPILTVISLKQKELLECLWYKSESGQPKRLSKDQFKILDTSAVIDGRIADLCQTGFLEGVLIIPNFVLLELQKIADSSDPLRRNRGRRGLEILNKIQKENLVSVRILDRDFEDLAEVDTKLLRLARELGAKVITNDYNLNKVAELYGVQVLNINDLSNAIKPVVIPGEEMVVHVLRDGKEHGQGIGYLEDGTMIVVEGGKSYIGLDIDILVTSILQTSAGRMIFAKPKDYLIAKVTS
jgi:uncharacterized protein YacL